MHEPFHSSNLFEIKKTAKILRLLVTLQLLLLLLPLLLLLLLYFVVYMSAIYRTARPRLDEATFREIYYVPIQNPDYMEKAP